MTLDLNLGFAELHFYRASRGPYLILKFFGWIYQRAFK